MDTNVSYIPRSTLGLDNGIDSSAMESDRERGGILNPPNEALGVVDTGMDRRLDEQLRPEGGFGNQIVDSTGNRAISSSASAISQSPSKAQGDGILLNNELLGLATGSFEQPTVPRDFAAEVGEEFESFGRHESDGLVGMDEYRRKPTQLSRLSNMADLVQTPDVDTSQAQDIEERVIYNPRSKANSLSTLAPAASLKGLENAFNKIEVTTGMSVDEYVRNRLNEPSQAELFRHYAAEQIDSLALAIYNHEYENKATLIGHDTGIGKTRIICGLARYAQQQSLTPVIVTVDPVLYGDILARDAVDTGNNFNPFITNNKLNLVLTGSNGDVIGAINTPENQKENVRQYAQSGNIGEHDSIFTTYGQLTGRSSVERRQLLNAIAPRSFLILDESHKAGGATGATQPDRKMAQLPSCTEFFQSLVTQTPGFVASSATAIKDPIVAARLFYQTTDLRLAALDQDKFTKHLKAGGVPLQQQVFALWAESGGCIRCEKSYEGVEFDVAKVPVSLETAENNSKILVVPNM